MSERFQRLERDLARELSDLIPTLKDPRVPMVVTVERVALSRDGATAEVHVSALDDDDHEAMLEALNRAAGHLQRALAARLQMRRTPRLAFRGTSPLPGDLPGGAR